MLAIAWLSRHQTLSASLILILVLHVCFFPFIWADKTLLAASCCITPSIMPTGAWYGNQQGPHIARGNDMGAAGWLLEPDAALVHHQYFREKHLPLWNPYQSYGAPLAANMQSQPFSPLFFLLALDPGPRTFNLFVLARFLFAGLCTYLYLRLFLPFVPSVAGGIACMLSGYYLLFFDMPELSVNMLVPAMFLATERLLRDRRTGNVMLSIAVTFLCTVGGMPESTFLILAFGGAYFIFRLAVDTQLRATAATHVKYFIFVQALGLVLAAFLLLPFFEFMQVSFDSHQPANLHGIMPGLRHDVPGLSIFTYLVPMLGAGVRRGFMGAVQILFALVAIASLARKTEKYLTLFFFGSAAAIVLKRYGAPGINAIGHLPLCRFILFFKYDEPLLAFALAVLCAIGMHQVLTDRVSRRWLVASVLIVFAVLVAALGLSLLPAMAANAHLHEYYLGLAGAVAVVFLATLILLGPTRPASGTWMSVALLALLTAEMCGNYIYPLYYVLTRSAAIDANPYQGAPYIAFLRARARGQERVFGREGILHPDWAESFQLADIRSVDAMYYRKYLDFIRFFLREELSGARWELVYAFTGTRWLGFDSPLKTRLLQLSSVKFLLSMQPYKQGWGRAPEIVLQNAGRLSPAQQELLELRTFTISGETQEVLYEHPPYARLPYRISITPATRTFSFNVAMQPEVYDGSMPVCGDGVEFRLEVRDRNGRIARLYDRYIDPKHNPAERRWIPGSVDLGAYQAQTVDLLFTTTPGPAGDACADWAGWGDPHFNGDSNTHAAVHEIYDNEVKIYEYTDTLPRAALFSDVELAPDDASALARLGSPSLDIFQTAVVSSKDLNAADLAAIRTLQNQPHERVRAARILSYTSQAVTIEAGNDQPALLVLNDSDYPGWKVHVDGRPAKWITANYLFRGVLLSPGKHTVRFTYEPASFMAGAAISGTGLLCLAGFAAWRRRTA